MFSGIIETLGRVRAVEPGGKDIRLVLDTSLTDLALGESVAVNGVCLTVTYSDAGGAAIFFVSPETLHRTSLGRLGEGDQVNLERGGDADHAAVRPHGAGPCRRHRNARLGDAAG